MFFQIDAEHEASPENSCIMDGKDVRKALEGAFQAQMNNLFNVPIHSYMTARNDDKDGAAAIPFAVKPSICME